LVDTDLLVYAGMVLVILAASLISYYLIYTSMINAYKELIVAVTKEYENTAHLYAQLYLQYLEIMKEYLNLTAQYNTIPSSLPSPPPLNLPQLPFSITVSLPNQVAIPVPSAWPPMPSSK